MRRRKTNYDIEAEAEELRCMTVIVVVLIGVLVALAAIGGCA